MARAQSVFIEKLRRRTTQAAIGASALRKQGAPGVIEAARQALATLKLSQFTLMDEKSFARVLDDKTASMVTSFPTKAQNWGAARKAVNLFLRDAVYNQDLCLYFNLARIREWLEVPLDKDVATGLCGEPEGGNLPRWTTIKRLQPHVSAEFQKVAAIVAVRHKVCRVDLDVYYWRPKK